MSSIKVLLYTSKVLKNGENPIVLRIIKDRKPKYISIGHSCLPEFWDFKNNQPNKNHPNQRRLNIVIKDKIANTERLILDFEEKNKNFSLDQVKKKIKKPINKLTVFEFLDNLISELKSINKIGTATVYNDTKRALSHFKNGKDFDFSDITVPFLNKYELSFRERGTKEISISYYMRTLRSLFNKAIKEEIARKEDYPFEEYKISKFKLDTQKRAISKTDIYKIINYVVPDNTRLFHSKNYFIFSFYNMGINFTDIALLKWENIKSNRLEYKRAKTGKLYTVNLLEPAIEILKYYKENYFISNSDYIFPILSKSTHQTETSIKNRIHKVIGQTNKDLKEMSEQLNLNVNLTTYVARHSWATILKFNGVPTAVISEGLGHRTEKTTQIYLDSFENSVLDEANKNIL